MQSRQMLDTAEFQLWQMFVEEYALSERQQDQLWFFLTLLREWSEHINLTTITSLKAILNDHFRDSLQLAKEWPLPDGLQLADIGTGAGFPGIPLAIAYPATSWVLLEVNHKKIAFLELVSRELALTNIRLCSYDWRTFLRQAPYEIDLFCARASLKPDELLRLFKPGCVYNKAGLVYWASQTFEVSEKEKLFCTDRKWYKLGNKMRSLIRFSAVKYHL